MKRETKKRVGDAITAPWDAYPGDLCAWPALCTSAPLIAIVDLLAAAFESYPPKAVTYAPPRSPSKRRIEWSRIAIHRRSASCCATLISWGETKHNVIALTDSPFLRRKLLEIFRAKNKLFKNHDNIILTNNNLLSRANIRFSSNAIFDLFRHLILIFMCAREISCIN